MLDNQKEKLFSNKFIQNYLENEINENNDKFEQISASLSYYLKSFSNVKKLLDYVCLLFKYIFHEELILIIPLNDKSEIWFENIRFSENNKYLKVEREIYKLFDKFKFSKKFKIKEIVNFETVLKNNFKQYKVEHYKLQSKVNVEIYLYFY